jgi:hypothetical protein
MQSLMLSNGVAALGLALAKNTKLLEQPEITHVQAALLVQTLFVPQVNARVVVPGVVPGVVPHEVLQALASVKIPLVAAQQTWLAAEIVPVPHVHGTWTFAPHWALHVTEGLLGLFGLLGLLGLEPTQQTWLTPLLVLVFVP